MAKDGVVSRPSGKGVKTATPKRSKVDTKDKPKPTKQPDSDRIKITHTNRVNVATERLPGTAYIRNLPLTTNRLELMGVLSKFGTITSCRLVMDKVTRALAGTAFCDFDDDRSVKKAAAAARNQKIVLQGVPLMVRTCAFG